jgi:hypothetical protein
MKVAELVRKADLIIWDEALMMHRRAFEAVDRTLRDLMQLDDAQATDKIFGGKIVVLGEDFRQILPVVPKGGRKDIVNASLPRSHLWQHAQFFVFISTCKSWQPILKSSESLPNGCRMLETVIFLPLQKKKVSIQIGSRFHPI